MQGLTGMCLYFLRTTNKAITPVNIASEVNFGMMDCSDRSVLSGLEKYLSKIVLPALKTLEVRYISRDNLVGMWEKVN